MKDFTNKDRILLNIIGRLKHEHDYTMDNEAVLLVLFAPHYEYFEDYTGVVPNKTHSFKHNYTKYGMTHRQARLVINAMYNDLTDYAQLDYPRPQF